MKREYIEMCKGNAHIPVRFWNFRKATTEEAKHLEKNCGYIPTPEHIKNSSVYKDIKWERQGDMTKDSN